VSAHPKVNVEEITPRQAQRYLDQNANFRKLSEERAQAYADQIRNGRWDVNGESIKFNGEGKLKDGQHRLRAVVLANKPIRTVVVRGIDSDMNIDTGARRSFSAVLNAKGYKNTAVLSSAVTWLWRWRNGRMVFQKGGRGAVGHGELANLLSRNKGLLDSMRVAQAANRILAASAGTFLHFVLAEKDPQAAGRFFDALANGVDLAEDNPVRRFRERLIKDKGSKYKIATSEKIALGIKAFNAFRRGQTMQMLVWKGYGESPEEYPTVE
jgi:hypothetical protein